MFYSYVGNSSIIHIFLNFSQGILAAIGRTNEVRSRWKDHEFKEIIDATGQCVIPGLIDAHTHPVWAGDRVHEFAMKVTYFYSFIYTL